MMKRLPKGSHSVARETFWINATRLGIINEGEDLITTGTDPKLFVLGCDLRVVIRTGVPVYDAIQMLRTIVVGLEEDGYFFGGFGEG